jgi:hexokinase
MYMYVLDHVLALRSWLDAEPLDEYQEPLSAEQVEQQQENFEERKYNMNILSLLNTISCYILILYAYKDFLATFILYMNTLGCILGSCARCCALT